MFFFHSLISGEEAYVKKNASLIGRIIGENVKVIDRQILDWSQWDDMYSFADAPTDEFIESSLSVESLGILGVNFVVIADHDGKVLFRKGINLETSETIPVPNEIERKLEAGNALSTFSSVSEGHSGIILFSFGPAFIVTRPIITSRGDGPPRGTIAFVKMIDEKYQREISDFLGAPVKFEFLGRGQLPPDFSESAKTLSSPTDLLTRVEKTVVFGYGFIPDVFGSPLLFYRFEGAISNSVDNFYFETSLLFLGFFIIVLFSISSFLSWTVPSRIKDLRQDLIHIREVGSSGLPLVLSGKDELSELADEINIMLQNMFRVREQSDIAERRFDAISDTIPAVVWMIGKDAQCLFSNKKATVFIGESGKEHFMEEWRKHIHPEDLTSYVTRCASAFEDRKSITAEYRISSTDGEYRWVLDSGVPYYSSPGVFLGFLHVAIDITGRKATEETEVNKRKEAERLNAIMVSRELRMIELKKEIRELRATFEKGGRGESNKK